MKKSCFFVVLSTFFLSLAAVSQRQSVVVLPAGDAHTFGRQLFVKYERGVSYDLAKEIKRACAEKNIFISVPFDVQKDHWQLIQVINQENPKLVIQLRLYPLNRAQPEIALYLRSTNRLRDVVLQEVDTVDRLVCKNIRAVYQDYWVASNAIARLFDEVLQQHMHNFVYRGIQYMPVQDLVGYDAPTLLIELGITTDDGWMIVSDVIAEAICKVGSL